MKRLLLIAGIGVLISALSGCSGMMQVDKGGRVEDSGMRADYLKENPDSRYAQNISKGEVTGGMNIEEVKASWGIPNAIIVEKDVDNQFWVYYTKGSDSGSVMIYTLNFQKDYLKDWNIEIRRMASFYVEGTGGAAGFGKISLAEEGKK